MRKDGVIVKGNDDFTALFPYIFRKRNESVVYYNLEVNVENLLKYIEETKSITFFQAVIVAMVKTIRQRPKLNRFIIGRRMYQRNNIEIGFVAKREFKDDAEELNVLIRVSDDDDTAKIIEKITSRITQGRKEGAGDEDGTIRLIMKFPRPIIRMIIWTLEWLDFHNILPKAITSVDPLRCSVYMANLGSVGIDAPFHHLYEWGTISLFGAIGKIGKRPVVDENGEIVARTMVDIKVTLDERIADGYYYARSLDLFTSYLENPNKLFEEES